MFLRKIIPQDRVFFDLFRELAGSVREAGEALTRCAENDCLIAATAEELKRIEHHADDVTHELLGRMESTFVTPFDREDIHMLADRLDEVVDMTEEVVSLAALYRIERLSRSTGEMARILGRACGQVADAVAALPATAPVLKQRRRSGRPRPRAMRSTIWRWANSSRTPRIRWKSSSGRTSSPNSRTPSMPPKTLRARSKALP